MSTATRPSRASRTWARRTWTYLYGHWELYLFLLPGLVFAMMFKLLPMSKIVIAFKNFKPLKGIAASPWVRCSPIPTCSTSSKTRWKST